MKATKLARVQSAFKSAWEREYAELLGVQIRAGLVKWFSYESFKIKLADGAWYTPDFGVLFADDTFEIHEVKGHWREAAKVRFKVAIEKLPFTFKVIGKTKGNWTIEEF